MIGRSSGSGLHAWVSGWESPMADDPLRSYTLMWRMKMTLSWCVDMNQNVRVIEKCPFGLSRPFFGADPLEREFRWFMRIKQFNWTSCTHATLCMTFETVKHTFSRDDRMGRILDSWRLGHPYHLESLTTLSLFSIIHVLACDPYTRWWRNRVLARQTLGTHGKRWNDEVQIAKTTQRGHNPRSSTTQSLCHQSTATCSAAWYTERYTILPYKHFGPVTVQQSLAKQLLQEPRGQTSVQLAERLHKR